jgi:hypothetical protein
VSTPASIAGQADALLSAASQLQDIAAAARADRALLDDLIAKATACVEAATPNRLGYGCFIPAEQIGDLAAVLRALTALDGAA